MGSFAWPTIWPSDTTVWLDPWYAGIKNQSGPWGSWNYPWFGGYYMRDQPLLLPEYRFVN